VGAIWENWENWGKTGDRRDVPRLGQSHLTDALALQWNACSWRDYLKAGAPESEAQSVRQCTHTGRPLGSEEFVSEMERKTGRPLAPGKGGRPAQVTGSSQTEFSFGQQ